MRHSVSRTRRRNRLSPWLFLAMGLCFFAGSAWAAMARLNYRKDSVRVQGTVVEMVAHRGFLHPVVQYAGRDGTTRTLTGTNELRPVGFERGQIVSVLYVPNDPEADANAVIDTLAQAWGVPLTLAGLGAGWLAAAGLLAWLARPRSWLG